VIPEFLQELQKFPILDTLRVHGDITVAGASSLSLSDCPHLPLRHVLLRQKYDYISPVKSITRLPGAFPDLQKLSFYEFSSIWSGKIMILAENVKFSVEELQIETSITSITPGSNAFGGWSMSRFLSASSCVQSSNSVATNCNFPTPTTVHARSGRDCMHF
jgi:hypothetical protein